MLPCQGKDRSSILRSGVMNPIDKAIEESLERTARLSREAWEEIRKEEESIAKIRWYKPWTWLNGFKGIDIF